MRLGRAKKRTNMHVREKYRLSHGGNRSAAFTPLHRRHFVDGVFRRALRISEVKRRERRAPAPL